jgi:hypothetical protein
MVSRDVALALAGARRGLEAAHQAAEEPPWAVGSAPMSGRIDPINALKAILLGHSWPDTLSIHFRRRVPIHRGRHIVEKGRA